MTKTPDIRVSAHLDNMGGIPNHVLRPLRSSTLKAAIDKWPSRSILPLVVSGGFLKEQCLAPSTSPCFSLKEKNIAVDIFAQIKRMEVFHERSERNNFKDTEPDPRKLRCNFRAHVPCRWKRDWHSSWFHCLRELSECRNIRRSNTCTVRMSFEMDGNFGYLDGIGFSMEKYGSPYTSVGVQRGRNGLKSDDQMETKPTRTLNHTSWWSSLPEISIPTNEVSIFRRMKTTGKR